MAGSVHPTRRRLLAGGAATFLAACARKPSLGGTNDPRWMDATALMNAIRMGDLSPIEVVAAAISRAEATDPALNAIVTPTYDRARAAITPQLSGPFAGIPTFIKDLTDVTGVRTQFGSRAHFGTIAQSQPPFVTAFEGVGFVSLGKSASPEFGLTATTEPLMDGPTRNPWNLEHSVGGSSGGAAALVAAGVVPIAHASDGGGSIRIPASCCGLVGLKPTRGRLPSAFSGPRPRVELSVPGVLTRSVRDTAAFYRAMEGVYPDHGLPPIGDIAGPAVRRLKIGFFTQAPGGYGVHKEVVAAIRNFAAIAMDARHEVEEIETPFSGALAEDFLVLWSAAAAQEIRKWEQQTGKRAGYDQFEPLTFGLADHFRVYGGALEQALDRLEAFPEAYARAFGDFDVLLSPVTATPPPPIGYLSPALAYELAIERLGAYAQFTGFHNVAGAPSISLPLGMSEDGLPIGALFSARAGDDRTLIELAFELENIAPWSQRRPPLTV